MRAGGGRRAPALPRRSRRALPAPARHLHRPQPRLPAGPARAVAGHPRPARRVRPALPARRRGTSPTTGCAGCSASRRSTRASRRSGRSPPTRSSPSSTSGPASGTRSAASPPCRAPWPRPRPTPESRSATATPAELEVDGPRVVAVRTGDGERLPADAVVRHRGPAATPLRARAARPPATGLLAVLRGPAPRRAARAAAGRRTTRSASASRGAGVFDELTRDGRVMTDPSLLVSMPSRTDRSLAPDGGQVLQRRRARRPTSTGAAAATPTSTGAARPALPRRAARHPRGPGLDGARPARSRSRRWRRRGTGPPRAWRAGTPFALAHTFGQTGPFRPVDAPPPRARRTSSWPGRRYSRASGCRWC